MKLKTALLAHQKMAVDELKKIKVGALFMEQGTGKTITTLELIRLRIEKNKIDQVIWLCPCSAKQNIKNEIIKHSHPEMLKYFVICGIETLSSSTRANVYLQNLVCKKKCFIVVDESLLIKNPKAYRSQRITKLAQSCAYRLILNGTPISKNEADLFSQFYILDWRILGYKTYWQFCANHLDYDKYGNVIDVINLDYLTQKIKPYTFEIKKEECIDLPSKIYETEYFYMDDEQEDEYIRVANKLLLDIDEAVPETIYRLFSGLQAVVSGKRVNFFKEGNYEHFKTEEMFIDPNKNPRIQALLDVLTDEKTIIFCRFTSEIDSLCNMLGDNAVRFDGNISQKKRNKSIAQFKNNKKYLIANRSCAGYSLNLQFCHNIIYFSNGWDLATRLQSEDRVHRIGQEHEIKITDICCADSIDERIIECLHRKERLLEFVKDKIKNSSMDIGEFLYVKKREQRGVHRKIFLYDLSDLEEN